MKLSKLLLSFGTLALAIASAATTYHFTIFEPAYLAGTQLKAGDYKVEVSGNTAMVKAGKQVVQASVKVEDGNEKYPETSVRIAQNDGKNVVQEIRLGGTHTRLVFNN